jgi:hypothetical protein
VAPAAEQPPHLAVVLRDAAGMYRRELRPLKRTASADVDAVVARRRGLSHPGIALRQ